MTRRSTLVFLCAASALVLAVIAALALSSAIPQRASSTRTDTMRLVTARGPLRSPFVLFRTLAPRQVHGRVSMMPIGGSQAVRYITPLTCAHVHYSGGSGLCLTEESSGTSVKHAAYVFHDSFVRGHRVELTGVPTRVRISPNGALAALTEYGEEESPAGDRLAMETVIVDVATGTVLADLREFALDNPEALPIQPPIDFTSVTFGPDSDQFFATLLTSNDHYLLAGSMKLRRFTIRGRGFMNEAQSPDGKRLIVKRRGARGFWQLQVLDLDTMVERPLNQGGRSVDDQVDWLDNEQVVYHDAAGDGTGIWLLRTDGVSEPRLLIPDAFSPSVVR